MTYSKTAIVRKYLQARIDYRLDEIVFAENFGIPADNYHAEIKTLRGELCFLDDVGEVPQYPDVPGHKADGTSKEAAESMIGRAPLLRQRALRFIKGRGRQGATPDEIAAALGESILSVRPRAAELTAAGAVEKSILRRDNISGRSATVLVHPDCLGEGER